MKPFNLEKAINGKAFYLHNGYRGVIKYSVDDFVSSTGNTPLYPYVGYILDDKGFIYKSLAAWDENGKSNMAFSYNATTMVDDTPQQDEGQTIKPFDLEKALAGEPVVLKNGKKALIYHRIPDHYTLGYGVKVTFPLVGMIFDEDGTVDEPFAAWRDDGRFASATSDKDIIGMYEEPKLTTEELMEKAFQEKLIIRHSLLLPYHKGFKVVGKTLDNDYILQDCDGSGLSFLCVFNEDIEWSIKDLK